MKKNIIISLILSIFWSCAGSNATSMEYRSAKTAIRSERDFKKGEALALQALNMEIHSNDAKVAYFLALEIYKPRKDWEKMNNMLDLAMQKNPNELLEREITLNNGKKLKTIADAVYAHKEEMWSNIINEAVSLSDAGKLDEALDKFNFAKSILKKVENYVYSALLYLQKGNMQNAEKELNVAIELEPNNYNALKLLGDLAQSGPNLDLEKAKKYYNKALENTDDKTEILQGLVFIHAELGEYENAINLSNKILENNPDDADIYFNVGVIYQRLGNTLYEQMIDKYKNLTAQTDDISGEGLRQVYQSCKQTLEMVNLAKTYFTESSVYEEDVNYETDRAIDEMKRVRKNIKNVYMVSIEKIAIDSNINLD